MTSNAMFTLAKAALPYAAAKDFPISGSLSEPAVAAIPSDRAAPC
jgi:hypothetical protein